MIAYLNCFSGISGDMFLGALVDAGVPLDELRKKLTALSVRGYELKARKVRRAGIRATKVDVVIKESGGRGKGPARKWKDIEKIIKASRLPDRIQQKGRSIFRRMFEAEAKVHGGKMEDIHLHELGAVDCIVDIFGTLIGLDILGIEEIYASPLNVGCGTIRTEHGILPVPAPATSLLLKGIPVYSSDVKFELTTPTGAVLVSSLSKGFGGIPAMQISATAVGAGGKEFKEHPNVLMMVIGERREKREKGKGHKADSDVMVIETNIDDMNPQIYEYVMERLFRAGALDVFLTQMIMKKGRPGVKLSVLCNEKDMDKLIDIFLDETTSIGVRFYRAQRRTLHREIRTVKTKYGSVKVKTVQTGKGTLRSSPEYEDCKKIASRHKVPLVEVMKKAGQ